MGKIGERLRNERELLDLSPEAFAKACGVGKSAQYRYESDERSPDGEYFSKAAEIGVDVLYVITGERLPLAVKEGRSSFTPAEHLASRLGGMAIDEATAKALLVLVEQFVALDPLLRSRVQGYLDALSDKSALTEGAEGMISLYDFSADGERGGSEKQGT